MILILQFQGKKCGNFFLWMSYVLNRANVYHVSYHLGQLTNHEHGPAHTPDNASKYLHKYFLTFEKHKILQ